VWPVDAIQFEGPLETSYVIARAEALANASRDISAKVDQERAPMSED
jgi:hypothetical protein